MIRNLNADLLALEEVEDCTVLSRLVALLPNLGYRHYLIKGTDTATGLLSLFPASSYLSLFCTPNIKYEPTNSHSLFSLLLGQNVGLLTRVDPVRDLYRTTERVGYPMAGSDCGFRFETFCK